jgi:hypothetical protein
VFPGAVGHAGENEFYDAGGIPRRVFPGGYLTRAHGPSANFVFALKVCPPSPNYGLTTIRPTSTIIWPGCDTVRPLVCLLLNFGLPVPRLLNPEDWRFEERVGFWIPLLGLEFEVRRRKDEDDKMRARS